MAEIDYSSVRAMPKLRLIEQAQETRKSTSLEDIRASTHQFNGNADQTFINLPE